MRPYLKYTFRLVWRQKFHFIVLMCIVAVETAVRLVQPYFQKIIVDTLTNGFLAHFFTPDQVNLMVTVIVVWFFCAVANNVINAYANYLTWQIGGETSQVVHIEGYKKLLRLDYHRHTQKHSSQYAKIVDEGDTSMWEMTNWWLGRFIPSF